MFDKIIATQIIQSLLNLHQKFCYYHYLKIIRKDNFEEQVHYFLQNDLYPKLGFIKEEDVIHIISILQALFSYLRETKCGVRGGINLENDKKKVLQSSGKQSPSSISRRTHWPCK